MYYQGYRIQLNAMRDTTLAGVRFKSGDTIEVLLRKDWDPDAEIGRGGPWGWGGYTHSQLYSIADQITDLQTGVVIWTY